MVVLGNACAASWPLHILYMWAFTCVGFVHMKPLGKIIQGFWVGCYQYADDTHVYLSLSSNFREAVEVPKCCLEAVGNWIRANKMKLNPDKMDNLVQKSTMQVVLSYLNGIVLLLQKQVQRLGMLLDSQLLKNQGYIDQLQLLCQLWLYLCWSDLILVISVLETLPLDYWNWLLELPVKMI